MSGIQPTDVYVTGIRSVDDQHRHFAQLINRLQDLGAAGDPNPLRTSLLNELTAYARFHFHSEENLMLEHVYPSTASHATQHQSLLAGVQDLVESTLAEPRRPSSRCFSGSGSSTTPTPTTGCSAST